MHSATCTRIDSTRKFPERTKATGRRIVKRAFTRTRYARCPNVPWQHTAAHLCTHADQQDVHVSKCPRPRMDVRDGMAVPRTRRPSVRKARPVGSNVVLRTRRCIAQLYQGSVQPYWGIIRAKKCLLVHTAQPGGRHTVLRTRYATDRPCKI